MGGNLDDRIHAHLRLLIVEGRIRAGQRVPVDALASRLGVSRTPVVNALKRLGQEGVIEWRARRGVFVRHFTKREMVRLFQVREALECLAARLAASRVSPRDVARLAALFEGFAGPETPAAIRRYIRRDREFHQRILELAANPDLARAMDAVNIMFFAYQDGLVRPPVETLPEHHAILEALRDRDPVAGEATMRLHLRRSTEHLEREAAEQEGMRAHALEGGGSLTQRLVSRPPAGGHVPRPRQERRSS